jgi:spoIIIJ-associated protein
MAPAMPMNGADVSASLPPAPMAYAEPMEEMEDEAPHVSAFSHEDEPVMESRHEPVETTAAAPGAPMMAREPEGMAARGEGRRERFRGRERGGRGERGERSERGEHREPREGREGSGTPDMSADELIAASRKVTEELLRAMGFDPKIEVRAEGNRVDVTVEVEGDDQLLIGRQGETRQSLQHLLNRFLNKGDGSRYHLQLEVNDFWQQREGELTEIAKKMAEDAVTQNAEIVSDYMNSQERRIMHVTLREDTRVRTFSLGTGMVKRVAVAPASFPERSEDDDAS